MSWCHRTFEFFIILFIVRFKIRVVLRGVRRDNACLVDLVFLRRFGKMGLYRFFGSNSVGDHFLGLVVIGFLSTQSTFRVPDSDRALTRDLVDLLCAWSRLIRACKVEETKSNR
jgi:hypothetical protein